MMLADPMVYVWDGPLEDPPEPGAICVKVPAWDQPYQPVEARELGYWPKYRELTPAQRRYYLDWLASGRATAPHELGYAFLFVYNLERRALVDGKDIADVAAEVRRLRRVYAEHCASRSERPSRSWETYTGNFLLYLVARHPRAFTLDEVLGIGSEAGGGAPSVEDLEVPLGWLAETRTPVPARVAFALAEAMPESHRGTLVRRVRAELRRLFETRYAERFGVGLMFEAPKRRRKITYQPASAVIATQSVSIPAVLSKPSRLVPLVALWNECVDELRKLSGVVGKQESAGSREVLTPEAWEATPAELREGVEHPMAADVARLHRSKGDLVVSVVGAREVMAAAGVTLTLKPTLAQCRRAAQVVQYCGFGVEPDPRLSGSGWKVSDAVALYPLIDEGDVFDNGLSFAARYQATACVLSVGMAVAQADGETHEDETAELSRQLRQAFDLRPEEYRRLEARRLLLTPTGSDLTDAMRSAKKLPPTVKAAVGQMAIAMAAADGVVTDEELAAAKKVYRAIGLEPAEVETAIHALLAPPDAPAAGRADVDEPVVVAEGVPAAEGEAIPLPKKATEPKTRGLRLDRAAVAAIMRDTEEVARMLAEAMATQGAEEIAEETDGTNFSAPAIVSVTPPQPATSVAEAQPDTSVPLDRVPVRFRGICEALLARGEWPADEAQRLASEHKVMLAGALEQLNDWAVEHYGAPVFIVDGDRLLVETAHFS
jgi:tellurite resistance protein